MFEQNTTQTAERRKQGDFRASGGNMPEPAPARRDLVQR